MKTVFAEKSFVAVALALAAFSVWPLSPAHAESGRDVAGRIEAHAERYHNAGKDWDERIARAAADLARNAGSVERAHEIERAFNRGDNRTLAHEWNRQHPQPPERPCPQPREPRERPSRN